MKVLALVILVIALSGCSAIKKTVSVLPFVSTNDVKAIGVVVRPMTRPPHAVVVDLVFVHEELVNEVVSGIDAATWFESQSDYCRIYSDNLDVLRFEIVAGFGTGTAVLPKKHHKALAVYAFSNYPSGVGTQLDVSGLKVPWLTIDEDGTAVVDSRDKGRVPGADNVLGEEKPC